MYPDCNYLFFAYTVSTSVTWNNPRGEMVLYLMPFSSTVCKRFSERYCCSIGCSRSISFYLRIGGYSYIINPLTLYHPVKVSDIKGNAFTVAYNALMRVNFYLGSRIDPHFSCYCRNHTLSVNGRNYIVNNIMS